jgi:hypothetical protein
VQTGPGDKPARKARPPKVKKPTVVKPPAGDIASSGGDYGMKQARRCEKSARPSGRQPRRYDAAGR